MSEIVYFECEIELCLRSMIASNDSRDAGDLPSSRRHDYHNATNGAPAI